MSKSEKKKTKEKGFWGQSIVDVIVFVIEFILSVAVIINSIVLVSKATQAAISIYDKNFDNYYQSFYDEKTKEYFPFALNGNTITEKDIEENDVSNVQIVIYGWAVIISTEVCLGYLICVCQITRKMLKKIPNNIFEKDNLETIKKVKKYLVIGFVVPLVISFIVRLMIQLPMIYNLNILVDFFAIFAFFDFVRILLEQGIELKKSK